MMSEAIERLFVVTDEFEIWQLEEEIAALTRALEVAPHDAEIYCKRAETFCKLQRYDKAKADCRNALRKNDQCSAAHYLLGHITERKRGPKGATIFYWRAAELEKNNGEYHHALGMAYFRASLFHLAVARLATAVKLEPENAQYEAHLAEARTKLSPHFASSCTPPLSSAFLDI